MPGGEGGAFSRWADGISPQASPFDSKPPEESGEFQSDGVGWYLGSTWAKREGGGDPASYGYPTLGQVQKVAYVEPGQSSKNDCMQNRSAAPRSLLGLGAGRRGFQYRLFRRNS